MKRLIGFMILAVLLSLAAAHGTGGKLIQSFPAAGTSWKKGPAVSDFTQKEPYEGMTPSESTTVRIAYDDEALYVYAELFDSKPGKISAQMTRRDRHVESDNFSVDVDSYHDHRNARRFEVNAAGSQRDGIISGDNPWADYSWDGVWESKVKRSRRGWTAEMRIPWFCLRFAEKDVYTFGINFNRTVCRKKETVSWIPMRSDLSGYPSRFGHLTGIQITDRRDPVENLPYLGLNTAGTNNTGFRAGADFKYTWKNDIALNAALNPDFGQVEADRAVLNLSAFETFYPEKRPFFLESQKIFETPYQLFYSRRIGKPPASPELGDNDTLMEQPVNTTILGAAKLTGKFQNGLQFGIVEAFTQEEQALLHDTLSGSEHYQTLEPRTVYQASRVKMDILTNSQVGFLLTSFNRTGNDYAITGGTDWNIALPFADLRSVGQIVSAKLPGQRANYGGILRFHKITGTHIRGNLSLEYQEPELDLNHMGFHNNSDRCGFNGNIMVIARPNKYALRDVSLNFMTNQKWNFNDRRVSNSYDIHNSWHWNHYWMFNGLRLTRGHVDDKITGDNGPDLGIYRTLDYWTWAGTDGSRPVSGMVKFGIRPEGRSGSHYDYGGNIGFKLMNRFEFETDVTYASQSYKEQFVKEVSDVAVSGSRETETLDLVTRLTYLFSNALSLQLYNQLFFSKGEFSDFTELGGDYSHHPLMDFNMDELTGSNSPDFMGSVCNTSLLLRWEYLPGSCLYAVWSQQINPENIPFGALSNGFKALSGAANSNAFMLKLSYRLLL